MRDAKQEMLPWPLLRGHLLEQLVCRLPRAQNSLHLLPSILLLPLPALPSPSLPVWAWTYPPGVCMQWVPSPTTLPALKTQRVCSDWIADQVCTPFWLWLLFSSPSKVVQKLRPVWLLIISSGTQCVCSEGKGGMGKTWCPSSVLRVVDE